MLGQDFLVDALEELIPNNESEDSLKKVSRTSLIPVDNFPTVIIEEDGYDFSQETGKGDVLIRKESYNIAVVVKGKNINELSESSYKNVADKLDILSDDVIAKILEKAQSEEKVANVRFGRGEKFDGTISSVPVMWNMIPAEITMVSN